MAAAVLRAPVRRLLAASSSPLRRSASSASTSASAAAAAAPSARARALEDSFCRAVEQHLPADGHGVVFATAWLASDNTIVHLLAQHFPTLFANSGLLAVDTLHLFPETLEVAERVQRRYGKRAAVFRPLGLETRADFVAKYGEAEAMPNADFDLHSKVEPYGRGLLQLNKTHLITGRRMDQAAKRIALDVWEPQARTLNPLFDWTWPDVTAFVDAHDVPVNSRHKLVFRAQEPIADVQRHRADLPWVRADLGRPYWRVSEAELKGGAPLAYVCKSFGDVHTSVPVLPHESERAGRFVRLTNTECGIHTRVAQAGAPHGGKLVNRYVTDEAQRARLLAAVTRTHVLTERQSCDVELLCNGGFSPLQGFMSQAEFDHVVKHMRLPEQQLWAMPVALDTDDAQVKVGETVALTYGGRTVAVLEVSSVWQPDKAVEAHAVFGTASLEHPGVYNLAVERGRFYVGGAIFGLEAPVREGMVCKTPREVRAELPSGGAPVVAFQCRNPIHRAHFELVKNALRDLPTGAVLVHPTVGPTQPGDIDARLRVRTYEVLASEVADPRVKWAYLPFNMKMSGPREAIQHMIVRKNFGCTHFIIGRDMAGTKNTRTQEDIYGAYDAQQLGMKHAKELNMEVLHYENVVFTGDANKGVFMSESDAKTQKLKPLKLSGTEFRRLLRSGASIPEWFAFKSVVKVLRDEEARTMTQS